MIIGMQRFNDEIERANDYVVKVITDMQVAKEAIDILVTHYRHASALRFLLFVNIGSVNGILCSQHEGVMYKIESKLPHNPNHFDLYFITNNGAIASTCGEYAEYGFYNRHIFALYTSSKINLYPFYQCSSCWFDPKQYLMLQSSQTPWIISVLVDHETVQSFTYHPSLSSASTAYDYTRSAYDKAKTTDEIVNLEATMTNLPVSVVKEMSQKDRCQNILREFNKLKTYTCPKVIDQLEELLSEVKLQLKVSSTNKKVQLIINGSNQLVSQPNTYKSKKGGNTRNKDVDVITGSKRSYSSMVYNAFVDNVVSPTKKMLSRI